MAPEPLRIVSPRAPDPRLDAVRAGDPAALEQVLRELLPRIRTWLYRLLGPRSDIDDATQDALSELASALPRFEGRASFATLAHRITVRVAYRYFGTRQRDGALSLVAPPPDEIDPESRAMHREALARLYRCLDRMPKKRRVAFVLCCVEGLSPQEAAEITGVSAVTMRSRLMHARSDVLRRLAGDPYVSALGPGTGGGCS
jgi:RNA polymerase sigma-70 factor (ECF subfamily)